MVYRRCGKGFEYLLLHRAHSGPDYAGDWAWTPPAGARQPGESILECAERELREEIGVSLPLLATEFGTNEWRVYAAEMAGETRVELDREHDRFEWVSIHSVSRCKPDFVAASVYSVGEMLDAYRKQQRS
ncbi:MAG: NUDIX domain-containing protein [Anaerolineales bacterium]